MVLKIFTVALFLMGSVSTFSQISYPVEKGVPQSLAIWRAENYSDVRYKLNLTIEKKAPTLKGTIEIRLRVKADTSVPSASADGSNAIILDWRKIKGHEDLSRVSNVSINGLTANHPPPANTGGSDKSGKSATVFEELNEHLVFKTGVKIGENVIRLDFESPILTSGSAITRYIDKEDGSEYIYSLFVPSDASSAFPVFDQPDLKARFILDLEVPPEWKAVTNSLASPTIFEKRNSDVPKDREHVSNTFLFRETGPLSTYVFAFAAGEFAMMSEPSASADGKSSFSKDVNRKKSTSRPPAHAGGSDLATKIYVRKSQAKKFKPHAKEIFRLNRESIKFFEEYFDYKFPFPKYDLVLIPEFPFGGMEHAGATFLRESSIIFPTEPTANNYISRASLLFHENAHQWFGDTVTMKWFDDLWLKEGFATFMAYKAMEKVMPEYNAWKVFYERTKPGAYATDVTKGTTPIYQEIPNLNSAKSAYGNIVYNKAPGFLKQAEFYLGEKEFQTAVRAFLKEHEFANAEWSDLVDAFEKPSGGNLKTWADVWVKKRGLPIVRVGKGNLHSYSELGKPHDSAVIYSLIQEDALGENGIWMMKTKVFMRFENGTTEIKEVPIVKNQNQPKMGFARYWMNIPSNSRFRPNLPTFIFPNYGDYAYGIFLLDPQSKKYALENIQNEKDDFLRSMMWGALWDSVRFAELDPKDYVELAIKNIGSEKDVSTISSILGRVDTAMTYYIKSVPSALADGDTPTRNNVKSQTPANEGGTDKAELTAKLEELLIDKIENSKITGQKITYYRAFLSIASSKEAARVLKDLLNADSNNDPASKTRKPKPEVAKIYRQAGAHILSLSNDTKKSIRLRTKDKFDIVTKLIILGDKDAPKLLAELERTETDDAAKRYAYAAKAGFASEENKAKYYEDFINNKEIAENWIDEASGVWNAPNQSELTLPYLEKALAELPNHKQNRKIFFVNGWVASFIGGQKSEKALAIVSKFLKDNPDLDIDLQRKILERLDGLERAVKIREKYSKRLEPQAGRL